MNSHEKQVLQFDQVSFAYKGSEPIVKQLNFHIKQGEFVSIIGASGTGKSTIFRLIVGLEEQTEGKIYLNEKHAKKRLGEVGFMPQKDLLIPWRNIVENIRLPIEGKAKKTDTKNILQQLEDVGLGHVKHKYPHELSGGMRQRVSFLRATQSKSDLLLLDEPFSALDAMTKLHMQEWLLSQWQQTTTSILFITHDIIEALFLSDRIFVIRETPIETIEEIKVPLERPRKREQLDTQEMIELKNQLMNLFHMKVTK